MEAPLQTRGNLSQYTVKTNENIPRNGNLFLETEIDPYAPSIAQDLLSATTTNEWRNIQDIVKLTFKAICDVVRC